MDDGFAIYKSLQRTDDDGSMKLHVDDGKRFGNKIGEVHFKFATHAYGAAIDGYDHVPITDEGYCVPLSVGLKRVFAKRTRALFYADGMWIAVIKCGRGLVIMNTHPVSETG